MAAFDAVLCLQVCHELCTFTIDGLDQVSWAQGSQCGLAASMDLWVDKSDGLHRHYVVFCSRPPTSEPVQYGLAASVTCGWASQEAG
jgi:hypothetical protein